MAQRRRKRTTDEQADDVPLASAVPKDIKRTSKLRGSWLSLMPFRKEGKSQVRRQDVSRRYHEQEIGVFVGAYPISAPGAPCLVEILKFL